MLEKQAFYTVCGWSPELILPPPSVKPLQNLKLLDPGIHSRNVTDSGSFCEAILNPRIAQTP